MENKIFQIPYLLFKYLNLHLKKGIVAEWLGSGLQHHLQRFESARYLKKCLLEITSIFFYICKSYNKSMWKIKNVLLVSILFFSFSAQSQCDYTLDNYKHIDCYGGNTGEIGAQ